MQGTICLCHLCSKLTCVLASLFVAMQWTFSILFSMRLIFRESSGLM